MTICVLHNDHSGAADKVPAFLDKCRINSNCHVIPMDTDNLDASVSQAIAMRCDRLVVAGGDGTLNRVVNVLLRNVGTNLPDLAIIPAGTGNDFARSLGIPIDDWDFAWQLAVEQPATVIDLGVLRMNDGKTAGASTRYFLNMAYSDFGGIAGAADKASKQRWGALTYWATAISQALEQPEHAIHVEADGREFATAIHGVIVANGRFVGGGVSVSMQSFLNDGRLDVTIVPAQPLSETLLSGLDLVRGKGEESERIITARVRAIRLSSKPLLKMTVDGEACGPGDVAISIVPRALRVVAGPACESFAPTDAASLEK